jgi:hypothetical protein
VAVTAPPLAAFARDEDYFRLNALILRAPANARAKPSTW